MVGMVWWWRYGCRWRRGEGGDGAGGSRGDADAAGGGGVVAVAVVARRGVAGGAVHLHVLAQRGGVRVGLVAAVHAAVVRLVGGVHVRVFLPIRRVGEPSVAAGVLAFERLFACKERHELINIDDLRISNNILCWFTIKQPKFKLSPYDSILYSPNQSSDSFHLNIILSLQPSHFNRILNVNHSSRPIRFFLFSI